MPAPALRPNKKPDVRQQDDQLGDNTKRLPGILPCLPARRHGGVAPETR